MIFKTLIRWGVIILLLAFLSGCCDNIFHNTIYTENSCPEFCAKAKSAWDRPLYFRLTSNGELFVYRSQYDYSLDEFLSEEKEVEMIYQKQLSPEELKELNNAFDTIGVWTEETLIAYDLQDRGRFSVLDTAINSTRDYVNKGEERQGKKTGDGSLS